MLPDFLFVGPGKTATTWIYEVLREHPEIGLPSFKDSQFFDRYHDRGREWYEAQFEGVQGKMVGEVSTCYFTNPDAPGRIRVLVPDAKLICCLRHPVDRALSDYQYRRGVCHIDFEFEEALEKTDILDCSRYSQWLDLYQSLFPKEQLKILYYDTLEQDPQRFCNEMFSFLDVDPTFVPSIVATRIRPEGKARSRLIGRTIFLGAQAFKQLGLQSLVTGLKYNPVVKRLFYDDTRPAPKDEWRAILEERLAGEISILAKDYHLPQARKWMDSLKSDSR